MIFLFGLLLLGGAFYALLVSVGLLSVTDSATQQRLMATVGDAPGKRSKEQQPAVKRLHVEGPEDSARFVIPGRMLRRLERNMLLAGYPAGWTMRNVLLVKILAPALIFLLLYKTSFAAFDLKMTGIGLFAVVIGYLIPDILLHSRAAERQQEMERQLPDALDKIVISIESGLGFETALLRASETGRGDLSDELVRTIQDIRLGMGRREAYEALAARTSSDDIKRFVRSVIQAEETGVSVSQVVRVQATEMRMKRRLRAEGNAQKVSVKMLFPLITCIMPVLFVVVLAPGVMTAIDSFQGR
jgi:tight adherence protein C